MFNCGESSTKWFSEEKELSGKLFCTLQEKNNLGFYKTARLEVYYYIK